ncbi:MAG: GNAT family N-acetyltransferase [bacterium]
MTLTIRCATPMDIPEVHDMIGLLARHHGEEPQISRLELRHQIFDLERGQILVAAEEEGLIGYALILTRPNLVTGGLGHDINHLFVVEWRRKAGIGRALIAAARAVSNAAGAEGLVIGTHPENLGAQRAYREMGLTELPVPGPKFRIALDETTALTG